MGENLRDLQMMLFNFRYLQAFCAQLLCKKTFLKMNIWHFLYERQNIITVATVWNKAISNQFNPSPLQIFSSVWNNFDIS